MKKNVTMVVMAIVLILQYLGLFPGMTNRDLADYIFSGVTGQEPVHSEKVIGKED
jgi:hypothetical protein